METKTATQKGTTKVKAQKIKKSEFTKKALREDLQKRLDALIEDGWQIEQTDDSFWKMHKSSFADGGNYDYQSRSISFLLEQAEIVERNYAKSTSEDKQSVEVQNKEGIFNIPTKTIEKPIKVLREDLELRKAEYEKSGWKFTAHPDRWEAEKEGASFFKEKLTELLDELDGLKEIEEKYSDTKVFATDQNIVEVDGSLFDDGGDIAKSLSVGSLVEKKAVENPFVYDGDYYVGTGASGGGFGWTKIECYKLVPVTEYSEKEHGKILTDDAKAALPKDHPDKYGYNRRPVTHKEKKFVLVGPMIKFVPKQTDAQKLLNLRRQIDLTHHQTVLFSDTSDRIDKEVRENVFIESFESLTSLYADFRNLLSTADKSNISEYLKRWNKNNPDTDAMPQNELDFCFAPEKKDTKAFDNFVRSIAFKTFNQNLATESQDFNDTEADVMFRKYPQTEQIVFIPCDELEESPHEPQRLRRETFTEESLRELGNSILMNRQIEPAVIRFNEVSGKHQIVVGERRWRAIKLVGAQIIDGKPSLKCLVMDLTDEECLQVQHDENHQRQNNDPILDAFYYKYLVEKYNYSVTDLSVKFGIDRKTARQTLLLNELIEEAKLYVIKGILPKKHACYVASFPEAAQKEIIRRNFPFKDFNPDKRVILYENFEAVVEDNIARRLENAPFDTEDENLHILKLKCSDCTKNTLNQGELFAGQFGGGAVCLDGDCFNLKTSAHRRLLQIRIAEEQAETKEITVEEALEQVPLVTERAFVIDEKLKNEVLTAQEILGEKECAYSVEGIAVEGVHKNKRVWICQNSDCEIHNPKPKAEELTESQRTTMKRELYMRVGNEMRLKILREAMNSFDDYTPFWQFDDLIRELLGYTLFHSIQISKQIKELTKHWKIPLKFESEANIRKFVDALDKRQQSQLLFLIAKASEMAARYAETPLRIQTIKKLTADYTNLDYELLEAETIAKLAPEEFKEEAEQYLSSVRHGEVPAQKPVMWTELQEDANR